MRVPIRSLIAAASLLATLAARADVVFILPPQQMHFPISAQTIDAVYQEGDAIARAAGLARLRPAGEFELRVWTTGRSGEGVAYVLEKQRVTTYAITRPKGRLHVVRKSTRRIAPGAAPIAALRAAWGVGGGPGCDISDAQWMTVAASLDGAPVAFIAPDTYSMCGDVSNVRMDALWRSVHALAGD
jgi:hypothetical protein